MNKRRLFRQICELLDSYEYIPILEQYAVLRRGEFVYLVLRLREGDAIRILPILLGSVDMKGSVNAMLSLAETITSMVGGAGFAGARYSKSLRRKGRHKRKGRNNRRNRS